MNPSLPPEQQQPQPQQPQHYQQQQPPYQQQQAPAYASAPAPAAGGPALPFPRYDQPQQPHAVRFCPSCGTQRTPPDALFCFRCGYNLAGGAAVGVGGGGRSCGVVSRRTTSGLVHGTVALVSIVLLFQVVALAVNKWYGDDYYSIGLFADCYGSSTCSKYESLRGLVITCVSLSGVAFFTTLAASVMSCTGRASPTPLNVVTFTLLVVDAVLALAGMGLALSLGLDFDGDSSSNGPMIGLFSTTAFLLLAAAVLQAAVTMRLQRAQGVGGGGVYSGAPGEGAAVPAPVGRGDRWVGRHGSTAVRVSVHAATFMVTLAAVLAVAALGLNKWFEDDYGNSVTFTEYCEDDYGDTCHNYHVARNAVISTMTFLSLALVVSAGLSLADCAARKYHAAAGGVQIAMLVASLVSAIVGTVAMTKVDYGVDGTYNDTYTSFRIFASTIAMTSVALVLSVLAVLFFRAAARRDALSQSFVAHGQHGEPAYQPPAPGMAPMHTSYGGV